MARQRNNIAALPYEQRRLVSRMLFEGAKYAEIRAAIVGPNSDSDQSRKTIHNSSLMAWSKGQEYVRYRTAREADEAESAITRAQATAMNDGRGPESMTDLSCMEIIRAVYGQLKGGQIKDPDVLASYTRALAPLVRARIAQDMAASRTRESALRDELEKLKLAHQAEILSLEQEIGAKNVEIARLAGMLQSAGIDPAAGAKKAGDGISVGALKQMEEKGKLL